MIQTPKIFVVSDLHLDHTNIIKYCNRPFENIESMNKVLVDNWNKTVTNMDTVFFLGDLAFGTGSRTTDFWLSKLKGKIIFIKGNHDKSKKIKFYDFFILEYSGLRFYLTHWPENVPKDWSSWAICGHHHDKTPFIDKLKKRINISVEQTNYTPVDIDFIIDKIT